MLATEAAPPDTSSDRKVLLSGLVVAIMAIALLLIMLLERVNFFHQSYLLAAIENGAVIVIL